MASTLWLVFLLIACACSSHAANFNIVVNGTSSHAIPSTLYGMMFEDISNSGDGGLYGEMIQNRAFQQVTPNTAAALNAWSAVNGASIAVVSNTAPVSAALPNSLSVTVPAGRTGAVGVQNAGYFGFNVNSSWTYNASFFYKLPTGSTFRGPFTVALKSTSGTTFASASIPVTAAPNVWTQVSVALRPTTSATTATNVFTLTVDGASASGQTIFFTLVSLFPPTFKNRPNGMRLDIATALQQAGPSFFRFPGGNNLGQVPAQRWIWNNTIGPLTTRPGRVGDWSYINTDGLGLLEYLEFIEDTGMQPIMAVWAGFSLGGTSIAENALAPYIQAAKDQIDFVIGDAATNAQAAKRAAAGHPAPFALKYVELGNEDFFASNTYTYRWQNFITALRATYPQLIFIATSNTFNPILTPNPQSYDVHVYQTPTWFYQNSFFYDGFARNGTIYFEGEYAAISTNANDIFGSPADGRLTFPTMAGAAGEAAFMTGFERNADIVFAASYAPLLGSVDRNQWTPNLVGFNARSVILSTSYYAQQLFSLNRGDVYLPSTLPSRTGLTFWSVTRRTSTSEVLIKISNPDTASSTLTFTLPFNTVATTGTSTILTGPATTSNTPTSPNAIVPRQSTFAVAGKTFSFTAGPVSVNVLSIVAR